jgi:putative peptide zinc metalloprotease protein
VIPNEEDLPGRFAQKGTLVAYVVDPADDLTARAIVAQDEIGLVRQRTREVEVMTAHWGASAVRAAVLREVPGGTLRLPTAALGTAGGGLFAIDPRDGQGLTTVERVFEIEIGLPAEARTGFLGQRVYVRFDHGYEPVGFQVYRALRQLFIRVFGV